MSRAPGGSTSASGNVAVVPSFGRRYSLDVTRRPETLEAIKSALASLNLELDKVTSAELCAVSGSLIEVQVTARDLSGATAAGVAGAGAAEPRKVLLKLFQHETAMLPAKGAKGAEKGSRYTRKPAEKPTMHYLYTLLSATYVDVAEAGSTCIVGECEGESVWSAGLTTEQVEAVGVAMLLQAASIVSEAYGYNTLLEVVSGEVANITPAWGKSEGWTGEKDLQLFCLVVRAGKRCKTVLGTPDVLDPTPSTAAAGAPAAGVEAEAAAAAGGGGGGGEDGDGGEGEEQAGAPWVPIDLYCVLEKTLRMDMLMGSRVMAQSSNSEVMDQDSGGGGVGGGAMTMGARGGLSGPVPPSLLSIQELRRPTNKDNSVPEPERTYKWVVVIAVLAALYFIKYGRRGGGRGVTVGSSTGGPRSAAAAAESRLQR